MLNQQPVRIAILTGFLILFLSGCSETVPSSFTARGSTMGTTYSVKISAVIDSSQGDALKASIEQLLVDVNSELSTYQNDSELSRFNQNKTTEPQSASGSLFQVVQAAQLISTQTDGAFDATVGPLVNLWGFGPQFKADQIPTEDEIQAAKSKIGYQKLKIEDQPFRLTKSIPDLYVDLSAIAKGYGVDRVAELIEQHGFRDYMVEIGGEVRVRGQNPDGELWRIAIEKPLVGERSVQSIVPLDNTAMATSGDYRNFFEIDGVRYSHTIDPSTGWPVSHDLTSVTVLAESSMLSDGWATAFMVLGAEKGYDLAVRQNLAVMFVRKTAEGFQEQTTPAFESYLKRVAQ